MCPIRDVALVFDLNKIFKTIPAALPLDSLARRSCEHTDFGSSLHQITPSTLSVGRLYRTFFRLFSLGASVLRCFFSFSFFSSLFSASLLLCQSVVILRSPRYPLLRQPRKPINYLATTTRMTPHRRHINDDLYLHPSSLPRCSACSALHSSVIYGLFDISKGPAKKNEKNMPASCKSQCERRQRPPLVLPDKTQIS